MIPASAFHGIVCCVAILSSFRTLWNNEHSTFKLLNNVPDVQVSDTTADAQSTKAGFPKLKLNTKQAFADRLSMSKLLVCSTFVFYQM